VIVRTTVKNEIIIEPETEFEVEFLVNHFSGKLTCFIKTGIDLKDIVGLKIIPTVREPK
jgi:hypothetical protein